MGRGVSLSLAELPVSLCIVSKVLFFYLVRKHHSSNSNKYYLMICFSGYELTGLARGGEQLAKLKRNYAKAVELLVELASLQVGGRQKEGDC